MTRIRTTLLFATIPFIHTATAPSSRAAVQPISLFKEVSDVNGFIARGRFVRDLHHIDCRRSQIRPAG